MPDAAKKKNSALEPKHIRSFALAGAVVGVVLLPIAAAQANPTTPPAGAKSGASAAPTPGPTQTAATPVGGEFCGASVTVGADGAAIQAQACVEQADGTVAAKVYVSNASATDQTVTLNLTRADGTLIQVHCLVVSGDTAGICETGALPTTAGTGAFNAIAELAGAGRPLVDGVLHAESGLVSPSAQGADGSPVVTEQ
ncbi:MAG TPA: hypothetical protein VGX23_36090 [Actinocrinis sp.]|nr:hypothetical protein [Actinocrinis sp.]